MKKLTLIPILFFLITLFAFPVNASSKTPIKVISILDGDTIKARIDNEEFLIRLIGIDCFEINTINRAYKQAYENKLTVEEVINKGQDAKNYVQKLYSNSKTQFFIFKGIDKYSRALGVVYFDNINLNEYLKKNNICSIYNYKSWKYENMSYNYIIKQSSLKGVRVPLRNILGCLVYFVK